MLEALGRRSMARGAAAASVRWRVTEARIGLLLVLPSLIIPTCIVFTFLFGIYITFHFWRLTTGNQGFVGLATYAGLFAPGTEFPHSILLTLEFTAIDVTAELILGTIIAHALNHDLPGMAIYRSILIMPLMTPPVVGALIWKVLMRSGNGGLFNYILWKLSLPMHGFLGAPQEALPTLVALDIWLNTPFIATILIAGLKSLPREPFEAAEIDGASSWQIFWSITRHLMVPFYVVALFFRLVDSLNVFDEIYGTTAGGPGNQTLVVPVDGYQQAFQFYDLSHGLAEFVLLFVLCFIAGTFLYRLVRRTQIR